MNLFTSYARLLAILFVSGNISFASDVITTIKNHHDQRRRLANTDIVKNEDLIRQASNEITYTLTHTPVNTKRHASREEKWTILRAVLGGRIIDSKKEEQESATSNPYSSTLISLTKSNLALQNHYHVLELTYNLGDCIKTGGLKSQTFQGIFSELCTLTGMDSRFYADLIQSVLWEHHLATCDQTRQNIFEILPRAECIPCTENHDLVDIILHSVIEINHPLSKFAKIYLDLRHKNANSIPYSKTDPLDSLTTDVLDSLKPLWTQTYSPYQFSAAKFLALSPYPQLWSVGMTILNNIHQYGLSFDNLDISEAKKDLISNVLSMRKIYTPYETLLSISFKYGNIIEWEEIKSREIAAQKTQKEKEEKSQEINEKIQDIKKSISSLCKKVSSEFIMHSQELTETADRLDSYTRPLSERQLLEDLLYERLWDNLSDSPESSIETLEAKRIIRQHAQGQFTEAEKTLENFLSFTKKTPQHEKITRRLFHFLLMNAYGDDAFRLPALIFNRSFLHLTTDMPYAEQL